MKSKSYVAAPKDITVLGIEFQAFQTEQGEYVLSQTSFALGMGMRESSTRNLRQLKSMKAIAGDSSRLATSSKLRVSSGKGYTSISCMGLAEITEAVRILAERGHTQAKSMLEASFATALVLEVQRQFQQDTHNKVVLEQAANLQQELTDKRKGKKVLGVEREEHRNTFVQRGKALERCRVKKHLHPHIVNADYQILVQKNANQILEEHGVTKPELAIEYLSKPNQTAIIVTHGLQTRAMDQLQPEGYQDTKKLTTSITQEVHDTLSALERRILGN